ncbi:MAG: excinuclease ABC subunit UvrA, partial [Parachlamydiaceae bacterium]
TLSVYYKGKNIYDVLEMDVEEALAFFDALPHIRKKLEMLHAVGLDYMKLGQASTTLSGGEAQRIKLAKELVRPATGKTLYILDEPTTGLHPHDIMQLLQVLHNLADKGNSIIVIEHNMELVKTADWILDLGPDGGAGGGELLFSGTPEEAAKQDTPTGRALQEQLYTTPKERLKRYLKKKKPPVQEPITSIDVFEGEQNNLKKVTASIPRGEITVCTGPSGSGKSSFAFETIYAEGQRRYIESLSPYARQFVEQMPKPKAASIEGLSPAVAIEQKSHAGNPRSTVGTLTEAYDYLRVLYARLGIPHDPDTKEVIKAISKDHVADKVMELPEGSRIQILAPIAIRKQDKFEEIVARLKRQGYVRIRLNDQYHDLDQSIESFAYDRKRKNALYLVIDRLIVNPSIHLRLLEAIDHAADLGQKQVVIALPERDLYYNLSFAVESTGKSYPEITPQTFAFNKQEGACPECTGLGFTYGANLMQKPGFSHLSTSQLLHFFADFTGHSSYFKTIMQWLQKAGVDTDKPLQELKEKALKIVLQGTEELPPLKLPNGLELKFRGLDPFLALIGKGAKTAVKEPILPLLNEQTCYACQGERLNPLARNVLLNGVSIGALCKMPVEKSLPFLEKIDVDIRQRHLQEVKEQIISRLKFLTDVGIAYISLDRKAPTLSGGEMQRIRLARQLGSGLTGVLYVLDEPTIGLHPSDNEKLNLTLGELKKLGNTLLMVEHDPLTIAKADRLIEFGPGSGTYGGKIVAQGTYDEILNDPNSLTGAYLSGRKKIAHPPKRKAKERGHLTVENACQHNLKSLSADIPIGAMTCITGVSGSGKSTLMHDVIAPAVAKGLHTSNSITIDGAIVSGIEAFERLITIDQNPIGLTSRSDVSTYSEVLGPLREFFAKLPQAAIKGLQPKNFSYYHRAGMCTHCWGLGYKTIELHFLPSLRIVCEECQGLRLNPRSLEVRYHDKNLGEILNLTVSEAQELFQYHPKIRRILDTLASVGLGYLTLGQGMATLSGGEAQRIKLSRELAKRSSGKTLYLLDEPTTGLHASDIDLLLQVLQKLVDKGNTIVIIEHNIDVIKAADQILDLGPAGGDKGGFLVASGTPDEIALNKKSLTGRFL